MTSMIFIVRHGQSEGNVKGILQGRLDLPLTDEGRRQAQRIGARLAGVALDAIHTSPQTRALDTATAILKAQRGAATLHPDARLREQDMGRLEGMQLGALRAEEQARGFISLQDGEADHGGESTAHVRERMRSFVEEVLVRGAYANVAIVSHGNALGMLLCELLNVGEQSHHPFNFPNASLATVRREGRRFRLLSLGDVAHLHL
jgi:broad specificity phosphatase PhoE